jgi:hypothetical protein
MRLSSTLLPSVALLLAGCSVAGFEGAPTGGDGLDPVVGQTILFVGTDATTLRTNIYQVQAVAPQDDLATDEERNAAVLDAEGFEVTALSDFEVGIDSPLQNEGDTLLPSEAPFAVPDRLGRRIALVATGYDEFDGLPVGRAAVLDLGTGEQHLLPDVVGLRGVRFSWLGGYMILLRRDETTGGEALSVARIDEGDPIEVLDLSVPGAAEVQFAGVLRDTDELLVVATDTYGSSWVERVDPATGTSSTIVAATAGGLGQLQVTRAGDFLAATLTDGESGRRTIGVARMGGFGAASWQRLTESLDSDCSDPAWNPAREGEEPQQLAYICHGVTTGRPDVLLWEGDAPPEGSTPPSMDTLTGGAQPAVPDGSMDGLVVRARLRWDPTGAVLLFGASSADDASEDEPMTLLSLDPLERRAVPVFDGDDGVADLAHFAAASSEPVLLVWDRGASGLDDSSGRHPIRLVAADPAGARTVRGVDLGRNLIVAYPLFLGGNTLLYP